MPYFVPLKMKMKSINSPIFCSIRQQLQQIKPNIKTETSTLAFFGNQWKYQWTLRNVLLPYLETE
jgi:hypothetical protein